MKKHTLAEKNTTDKTQGLHSGKFLVSEFVFLSDLSPEVGFFSTNRAVYSY